MTQLRSGENFEWRPTKICIFSPDLHTAFSDLFSFSTLGKTTTHCAMHCAYNGYLVDVDIQLLQCSLLLCVLLLRVLLLCVLTL